MNSSLEPHMRYLSKQTSSTQVVLASTSSLRKRLLRSAGIAFKAVDSQVSEVTVGNLSPKKTAREFALRKAAAVSERFPHQLVIGSDQTLEFEGELLRKPRNRQEAGEQLSCLSGKEHWLHSAVAVKRIEPAFLKTEVASARLSLWPLSPSDIEAYLDTEEWEGCVGSYRIEGNGAKLMRSIRGDYYAVLGLPLIHLFRILRIAGFSFFT